MPKAIKIQKPRAKAPPKGKGKAKVAVDATGSDGEGASTSKGKQKAKKAVSNEEEEDQDGLTKVQSMYLLSTLDEYLEARLSKRKGLGPFWAKSFQGLLEVTETDPKLSKEEADVCMEKLRSRFKNFYNNKGREGRAASVKVLNLRAKRSKRKRTPWKVYLSRNTEKLRPAFLEMWKKDPRYEEETEPPIDIKNTVAQERFKEESDAVREEMTRRANGEWDEDEDEEEGAEEALDEEEKAYNKLMDIQEAIDMLPNTLVVALDEIQKQTNFIGTITLVGPEPRRGGKLTRIHYANGKTPVGAELSDLFSEEVDNHRRALLSFAGKVFDPEMRRALALKPMGSDPTPPPVASTSASASNDPRESAGSSSSSGSNNPAQVEARAEAERPELSREQALEALKEKRKGKKRALTATVPPTADTPTDDGDGSHQTPPTLAPSAPETAVAGIPTQARSTRSTQRSTQARSASTSAIRPTQIIQNTQPRSVSMPEAGTSNREPQTQSTQANIGRDAHNDAPPEWLEDAMLLLQDCIGPMIWEEVLEALVEFERNEGFPFGKNTIAYVLPAVQRPEELSQWIRAGRKQEYEPVIPADGVPSFARRVYRWWMSLQPADRFTIPFAEDGSNLTCDILKTSDMGENKFKDVGKPSINGIYGVLCCLRWWMLATDDYTEYGLTSLLNDVLWVLRHLVDIRDPQPRFVAAPNSRKRSTHGNEVTLTTLVVCSYCHYFDGFDELLRGFSYFPVTLLSRSWWFEVTLITSTFSMVRGYFTSMVLIVPSNCRNITSTVLTVRSNSGYFDAFHGLLLLSLLLYFGDFDGLKLLYFDGFDGSDYSDEIDVTSTKFTIYSHFTLTIFVF
ncbi:hypothetical protein ONZ45_g13581 [Pleurotus djamor]|nr:hypothetical protein ONZ45_g13581 [Pleurotus djamor]